MLAGCGTIGAAYDSLLGSGPARGTPGFVTGFLGGVAAEEPRAALVGREVLAAGGTAADAAVAIGFALGVTLPSRASLAGGGVCLAYQPERDQALAATFLPRAPARLDPRADRPAALPGTPRGLFALHARLGRLPFERLVAPAEQLARFGTPVSRALARDLAVVAGPLFADPQARALFARPDGSPLAEGNPMVQPELGNLIGLIRSQGVGDLHHGGLARRLADASAAAGGALTVEELRTTLPALTATLRAALGNDTLHAAPVGGSIGAAVALRLLAAGASEAEAERAALAAAAAARAGADPAALLEGAGPAGGALPPVLGATTAFVVADREGLAVACALTMNNLFGTGRIAPGTGLVLAAAPGIGQVPPALPTVLLVANPNIRGFRAAGAASGGEGAPAALALALRRALGGAAAREAVSAPRAGEAERIGRVMLLSCPGYLPRDPRTCTWAADPRGHGLAIGAD
ncbi:gamma-glutamyltransferase [Elioraea sp.]|uniref:gamma-glutamyltransferase n=1 Tax=Elioraea sp. TaxID=2185103 RepID=UPI003F7099D3